MARFPSLVAAGFPHYLTQGGNRRRDDFENDSLLLFYLDLLREHGQLYSMRLLAFCLMTQNNAT